MQHKEVWANIHKCRFSGKVVIEIHVSNAKDDALGPATQTILPSHLDDLIEELLEVKIRLRDLTNEN